MLWKLNLLKLSVPVVAVVVVVVAVVDIVAVPFLLDDVVISVLDQLSYLIEVIPGKKLAKLKIVFLMFYLKKKKKKISHL